MAILEGEAAQQAQVKDPNTPVDVLFELGKKYPALLLENPLFPLWLLEDPSLSRLPLETLEEVAKQPQLPSGILTLLAKHEEWLIVGSVAENPNTPLDILLELAEYPDDYIGPLASNNPSIPRELIAPLDRVLERVQNIWRLKDTPGTIELAPLSPEEIQASLKSGARSRRYLAWCPELSVTTMEELLRYKESSAADGLAANTSTPPQLLIQIAQEYVEHYTVCNKMFWRDDLPLLVYGIWLQSSLRSVRSEIAEVKTTPPEILELLSKDPDDFVRRCVALRGGLPASIFWILARDQVIDVRCEVAKNKDTPPEVLGLLLRDPQEEIRDHAKEGLRLLYESRGELQEAGN